LLEMIPEKQKNVNIKFHAAIREYTRTHEDDEDLICPVTVYLKSWLVWSLASLMMYSKPPVGP
jgi:hypothetical protein